MPGDQDYQQYYAPDRANWRKWLEANHATSPGVWLVWCGLQILRRQCRYSRWGHRGIGWFATCRTRVSLIGIEESLSV